MKKRFIIYIGLWANIILSACVKGDGNYDYRDASEVTPGDVSGIETFYSVNSLYNLHITPEISGITNDEDYEYYWVVWGTGFNQTNWKDTIGYEKTLDYVVTLTSGTYELAFQAKNKQTGVSVYFITDLSVASLYSEGWFVTKSENGTTDLDLVKKDGMLYSNILRSVNGEGLPGEALKSFYQSGYYVHQQENPDGTVTTLNGQKVIYVLSDRDMRVYNAENMHLFKKFEDAFFEVPAKAPQDAFLGMSGQFLINNGKIHWIGLSGSIGKFGYPMLGDYEAAPFNMGSMNQGMLIFDKKSSSFKGVPYGNTELVTLTSDFGQQDCNNMNCDLIFMDEQTAYFGVTKGGIALLKHKEKKEYYGAMLNMNWSSGKNPFVNFVTVPEGHEVVKGKLFATNCTNDVLYFSDGGNTVGMYNVSNGIEKKAILTYPAGENVGYIRHISYTTYNAGDQSLDCLAVFTNSTAGWKVYLYHFIGKTADIETPHYQSFSGKGTGKNVLFRGLNAYGIN